MASLAAAGAAGSAAAGPGAMAVVLVVEQVLLAWAWTSALRATTGTMALIVTAAVASDVTLLASDSADAGNLVGVAGLAIVTTILYQLARRRIRSDQAPAHPDSRDADGPLRVTSDMAAALGGIGVVVLFASLLALRTSGGSSVADARYPLVVAGLAGAGAAVVVARCLDAVVGRGMGRSRLTAGWTTVAGIAAAVGAGSTCGALAQSLTAAEATAVAVVAGAAAGVADAALARAGVDSDRAGANVPGLPSPVSPQRPGSGMTSLRRSTVPLATVLPLAVAAPAVYLVGQLLLP